MDILLSILLITFVVCVGKGFEITGCNDFTSHKKCAPGLKCKNSKCVLDKGT